MVDVSTLNARIVYLFLYQSAFGIRARPTRNSLLIQLGKEFAYKNQQPSSNVAYQFGDNEDIPSGPPQKKRCYFFPSKKDRKTKILCVQCRKNVCTEHSAIVWCECRRLQANIFMLHCYAFHLINLQIEFFIKINNFTMVKFHYNRRKSCVSVQFMQSGSNGSSW